MDSPQDPEQERLEEQIVRITNLERKLSEKESIISGLQAQITTLSTTVSMLNAVVQDFSARFAHLESRDAPRPLKLSLPEKFDGSEGAYANFKMAVTIYMEEASTSFGTDTSRTNFVQSLFTGEAAAWFRDVYNPQRMEGDLEGTFAEFLKLMDTRFTNPRAGEEARRTLGKERWNPGQERFRAFRTRMESLFITGKIREAVTKIDHVKNMLPKEIRDQVELSLEWNRNSYEDFIAKVENADLYLPEDRRRDISFRMGRLANSRGAIATMMASKPAAKVGGTSNQMTLLDVPETECLQHFLKGVKGHSTADCRYLNKPENAALKRGLLAELAKLRSAKKDGQDFP